MCSCTYYIDPKGYKLKLKSCRNHFNESLEILIMPLNSYALRVDICRCTHVHTWTQTHARVHQLLKMVYGFQNLWISSQDFTDFSLAKISILYVFYMYQYSSIKLQERTCVQLHMHGTSIKIFVTCLHVYERLMMYELPVQTSRTHACAIARARHVYRNIYYMLSCARKIGECVHVNCLC